MTKERIKEYFFLMQCLRELHNENIIVGEDYFQATAMLMEKMHEEYIEGDSLDKTY